MSLADRDYYQEKYEQSQKPGKNWWLIILGIVIILGLAIYLITR